MPQVADFSMEKVTFGWLQLQAMLHESFQYGMKTDQVLLFGLGVDNHVIQVYQGVREVQLPQTILPEVLECCWSVTQPLGHAQKLVHSHAAYRKGGVLPGLLSHLNLPEPTLQVHARKVSGTHHALHGLLHMRQGIGILFGSCVQAAEVDTELERPILLPHQHHGITPW